MCPLYRLAEDLQQHDEEGGGGNSATGEAGVGCRFGCGQIRAPGGVTRSTLWHMEVLVKNTITAEAL